MSCEIIPIATFNNTQNVIGRLRFPEKCREDWLNSCLISISPTQEIIILAYDVILTVLISRWDITESRNVYSVSWSDEMDPIHPITAVMALPLADLGKETQVGTDWTCIIVGFASGHCKFYTENMGLLLSVRFHNESILHIKSTCSTISNPNGRNYNENTAEDELYITYRSNISVVSVNGLFQILRNNRQELARAQGTGSVPNLLTDATLSIRKWGFTDQGQLNDCTVVGLEPSNTFSHLSTASIVGGFNSRYRSVAPKNTLVITAGARPYIGFQYALEGGSQPIFSDMAKAVASKLKSALPSWLTGSRTSAEPLEQPPIPAEAMSCRFGICDLHRKAESVILSPDKLLAAVTDSLGRVCLVDNHRGVILRIWKGYRGAQCAFLSVLDPETRSRRHAEKRPRFALFLIVYLPKKGLIEIWAMQQGPKVATFSAATYGRLFYVNYSKAGRIKQQTKYSCLFMDPDGTLKEFAVPFHFAIADKDSKRARDLHLTKRLKAFIKSGDFDNDKLLDEVLCTVKELRTVEIKTQCVDMLVGNKHITDTILLAALEDLVPKESDGSDEEFVRKCNNLKGLTQFYIFITTKYEEDSQKDEENGNIPDNEGELNDNNEIVKSIDSKLQLSERDLQNIQRLLDLTTTQVNKTSPMKVTFKEEKKSTFSMYIASYDCAGEVHPKVCKYEVMYNIAEIFFGSYITTTRPLDNWLEEARLSGLPSDYFVKLLLIYWLNRPLIANMNLENEMLRFSEVLYEICKLVGLDNICAEYNDISPWWEGVRDLLTESPCPFKGLMAAILCRVVAQRAERERELLKDEDSANDIWERVSADNCKWSLLIGKLDDVSLLNVILNMKNIVFSKPILPKLDYEGVDISLKYILCEGKGIVTELVAKWLASYGVNPREIVDNELIHLQSVRSVAVSREPSVDSSKTNDEIEPIFEQLNQLYTQFPFSLQSSVLLSSMAWEYSVHWSKNLDNIRMLKASLQCLDSICNVHLQHGVCALMWCMHIRSAFESVCRMLNKAGKLPKDRLCKQETGLSDGQLVEFLNTTIEFLILFMKSIQKCYDTVKEPMKYEDLWEESPSPPLSQLALQQTRSNYELLLLHYELACSMYMLTYFNNIRIMKPLAHFFDNFGQQAFFIDINSRPQLPVHAPDQRILSSRTQFLTKIITASLDLIHKDNEGVVFSADAFSWMERIKDLGSLWAVEQEVLVKHQVMELFRRGFDGLAEDMMTTIADVESLGPLLLDVAAKQLLICLDKKPDKRTDVAALGPTLTTYLDKLVIKDTLTMESEHSIRKIATHALRCLHEESTKERTLAGLIIDASHVIFDN